MNKCKRIRVTVIGLFLLIFVFSPFKVYAQEEKMIFAVDVIRHGDRTPIHDIPASPYEWPQGPGQLTAIGMQQEFQLGGEFRRRYIQDNHLLPLHFDVNSMVVRSTDFDRTIMSAECVLMGLYPLGTGPILPRSVMPALPSRYQPVPVHTISELDTSLASSETKKIVRWLIRIVEPEWQKKTMELQPNFSRWSTLTGMKINGLEQLISLADTLYIRRLYHIPLPTGMTEKEASTIIESGQWTYTAMYKPKIIGWFTGRGILKTIAADLQQASQHNIRFKFMLFSAHDSTLLSLMSAMHVPLAVSPRYASDLNFALYDTGTGVYKVRVKFNGKPVDIPGCDGSVCTLSQFLNLV